MFYHVTWFLQLKKAPIMSKSIIEWTLSFSPQPGHNEVPGFTPECVNFHFIDFLMVYLVHMPNHKTIVSMLSRQQTDRNSLLWAICGQKVKIMMLKQPPPGRLVWGNFNLQKGFSKVKRCPLCHLEDTHRKKCDCLGQILPNFDERPKGILWTSLCPEVDLKAINGYQMHGFIMCRL